MNVNPEKAIEVNNELKLNFNEQWDDIKHLNNVTYMMKMKFRKSQLLETP